MFPELHIIQESGRILYIYTFLAESACGLVGFIRNGGKMLIVASPKLTSEDIEKIKSGYNFKKEMVDKSNLLREIETPFCQKSTLKKKSQKFYMDDSKQQARHKNRKTTWFI